MALKNKEAVQALDTLIRQQDKRQPYSQEAVNVLVTAVHTSLQFRDYVMGELPKKDTEGAIGFISEILPLIDEGDRAPFYTILSGYYYEIGDSGLAYLSILQAQLLDPDYKLAKLFDQVYKAGWGTESFPQMRAELHPKVSAEILENLELELA